MNRFSSLVFALLACASCASADDTQLDQVRKKVMANLPGIEKEMITPSTAPGLYQIQKGAVFGYVTADGRYLISGDMVDLVSGEEVTEKQRQLSRVAVLKQFGPDSVIEFAPKDPKYVVTVFTDIDCGYCRKLHSEMSLYHAKGIAVRYLFYPRSGPNTESFAKAQSVMCSADRKEALTQAKRGVEIKTPATCPNPVLKQYEAGEALGINATPMLILPDGEIVRGYVPANALASRLAMGKTPKVAKQGS
jgi:thiol:disulfide interchange protein DsbC